MASTRFLPGGDGDESTTTWKQAVVIGLLQGAAVFPGLSRSGADHRGRARASGSSGRGRRGSASCSGVPAIAGVTVVELVSQRHALAGHSISFFAACVVGMAAAAVSGYCALRIVLATVSSRVFHRFAWYCVPLGLVVIAIVAGMN